MDDNENPHKYAKAEDEHLSRQTYAVAARYDCETQRIIIGLHNGVELLVPVRLIESLSDSDPIDLVKIEISPSGFEILWPELDVEIYVPALLLNTVLAPSIQKRAHH